MKIPILLFWTLPLVAQTQPAIADILRRVSESYGSTREIDFSAKFAGRAADGSQVTSTFRLAAKFPDKLRMEFDAVGSKMLAGEDWGEAVMVIDGKSTWIYLKGLNQYQVTSGAPPDHDGLLNPKHDPSIFVPTQVGYFVGGFQHIQDAGRATVLREETVQTNGKPTACYVVEVSNGNMVERLWIDKNRYWVVREDSMDPADTSSTVFTALTINEALSDDLFTFTPPPGARKVDKVER